MIGLIAFTVLGLYLWGSTRITKWAIKKAKAEGRPGWHYGLPAVLLTFGIMFWDWIPTLITHQYNCATEGGFTLHKTLEQWKAENPGVAETLVAHEYPINIETLPPEKYRYKIEPIPSRLGRDNGRWEYYRYPSGIEVRAEYNLTKGRIREELRGKLDTVDLFVSGASSIGTYYLNQRFGVASYSTKHWFGIRGRDERVIDLKTGEVLAQRVDFSSAMPNQIGTQDSLRDFKGWLAWGMGSCPVGKYPDPKWTVDGKSFISWKSEFQEINGERE